MFISLLIKAHTHIYKHGMIYTSLIGGGKIVYS